MAVSSEGISREGKSPPKEHPTTTTTTITTTNQQTRGSTTTPTTRGSSPSKEVRGASPNKEVEEILFFIDTGLGKLKKYGEVIKKGIPPIHEKGLKCITNNKIK